jgi:hypothetical protein
MNFSPHFHLLFAVPLPVLTPVYLGTSSVTKRCLHSYQHLHCDCCAWVVTLSVLELVQLADMFRFIVVYWVKVMNCIENITTINRSKLLSRCDRLPLVSQALSVVMYIILVTEWITPSVEDHIDSFIPAVPHVIWMSNVLFNAFSIFPMFLYKERVKKSI